jgi:hypothetical protein
MHQAAANETAPALAKAPGAPRRRLRDLLDEWMALDETRATWDEVEALYRDIVAFWHADPDAAEASYWAWRAARSASGA